MSESTRLKIQLAIGDECDRRNIRVAQLRRVFQGLGKEDAETIIYSSDGRVLGWERLLYIAEHFGLEPKFTFRPVGRKTTRRELARAA